MERKNLILIFLFLSSGIFYYIITEPQLELEQHTLIHAIDGDTVEIETGEKIRLKGINAPEKGELLSEESKQILANLENKTIHLENHGKDRYGRILGYIYFKDRNINIFLIEKGLAHSYFYEGDNHQKEIINEETKAQTSQIGIWKISPNSRCISLIEFQPIDGPNENETLILQNLCNEEIKITIKDEATHIFKEIIKQNSQLKKSFKDTFNDNGDTLFIWDEEGMILYKTYS